MRRSVCLFPFVLNLPAFAAFDTRARAFFNDKPDTSERSNSAPRVTVIHRVPSLASGRA